jgi:hypothetical protein
LLIHCRCAIAHAKVKTDRIDALMLAKAAGFLPGVWQPDEATDPVTPGDWQGTESRLTAKRPQDLQQIFRVPGGPLAASLD